MADPGNAAQGAPPRETSDADRTRWVALLRARRASGLGGRLDPGAAGSGAERDLGAIATIFDAELGLLADVALEQAAADIELWRARGITVLTPSDAGYPVNLRRSAAAPPLLWVAGRLIARDARAVAVVGTRQPSLRGLQAARTVAVRAVQDGLTVVSGLAAGIDTAVHQATITAGGRTLAVVGSGLDHAYPLANAELQGRIAAEAAVVSPFWPEVTPSRRTFPIRTGLMAALTLATVIVEASVTSGTRIQARRALAEGRTVVLLASLLEQSWARDLAERPGVEVVGSSAELSEVLRRVTARAPIL